MGFAANKVAVHVGGHAIDILVVFGKDLRDHIGVGSGSDHELKKCVARVFQLMVLGEERVRKVGELAVGLEYTFKGTEGGIKIGREVLDDGLFAAELALVVGVAGNELVDQLRAVLQVGVSRGLDRVVAGGYTLVCLGGNALVTELVA